MFALIGASLAMMQDPPQIKELIITESKVLTAQDVQKARIVVRASHIVIDGSGLTLTGPGHGGSREAYEKAGVGVRIEGCTNVTLKNLAVRGFETGLFMKDVKAPVVEGCNFSFNYTNPDHGWGELPARGGIILRNVSLGVFRNNQANQVWDALNMEDSSDNLFLENDFSHTTNTSAKLWTSSRNKFLNNDLSYGIRINREAGEVHARDSTSVLIESGSDDNYFYRNNITHGGDGVFIRVLNGWVSEGNIFVENDTSFANNNCVEAWSPGNTYVRNIANRGSYGFWLGGSDHTTLIGNTASFNGLESGYHNAPEPGFKHGGIVVVGGPSSHSILEGNVAQGNNGGGIVFRGDAKTQGEAWSTHHWIIQQNKLLDNLFGIWGKFGDWIHLANNSHVGNGTPIAIDDTQNLTQKSDPSVLRAPIARLRGPNRALAGQQLEFDASGSSDPGDRPLTFTWRFGNELGASTAIVKRRFTTPGFYRVGLTVDNGALADMQWIDLLVVDEAGVEIGTEGEAANWGGVQAGVEGPNAGLEFTNDPSSVVGNTSLRLTPKTYKGMFAGGQYPSQRDANWDLTKKTKFVFWIRAENPNIPAFQEAGPVLKLLTRNGEVVLQPSQGRNMYVNMSLPSEARYLWTRVEVPLAGSEDWERKVAGNPDLRSVQAFSISFDSWGGTPFTLWIDGAHFE